MLGIRGFLSTALTHISPLGPFPELALRESFLKARRLEDHDCPNN